MKLKLRYSCSLAMTLLVVASASARDIFVDNVTGDDRRGGSLPTAQGNLGPCQTIAKALRIAQPGDRIVLTSTGQPYRESITIQGPRHSGSDRYPFTLVGNGATLDGTTSLAGAHWQYVANNIFRTRPILKSFQLLFLDDQLAARKPATDGKVPVLAAREWTTHNGWLYFCVDPGQLPQAYNLACCGEQAGITLYEVHDVVIEDLTIRGFQLDGANCHDNVRRTDLVRLTTKENGRSGISIGGASRVRLDTCKSAGNGAAQVRVEGYSVAQLIDNTLDPATAPAIDRQGGRIIEGE